MKEESKRAVISPVDLMDYAREISNQLIQKERITKDFSDLESFPLIPTKQALYVMDWQKNQVTFQRNIQELLGYSRTEFDDKIIHTQIHPNDINVVSRVIKGIVNHYVNQETSSSTYLTITYRLIKRDRTIVKILRQSGAYETMPNGQLISNWSFITDISFISNNDQIEWDVNANEVDRQKFKEKVYEEFKDFFTPRELLVINAVQKGLKNFEIAQKLFISEHTVRTHRKNILRKCNCSNKEQLLSFCYRNGIF